MIFPNCHRAFILKLYKPSIIWSLLYFLLYLLRYSLVYSLKTVVNFYTQLSCSLSEERTAFFSREQNYTANQNLERCFFKYEDVEENDTSNQKPQRTWSCTTFSAVFRQLQLSRIEVIKKWFFESIKESFSRREVNICPEIGIVIWIVFTVTQQKNKLQTVQWKKPKNEML